MPGLPYCPPAVLFLPGNWCCGYCPYRTYTPAILLHPKIVIKFPNFGSNTQTLVPGCFCDLQIGSKCTAVQQFFRALRRIRPAYHLGRTKIARSSAACNVNPIFAIPCRNLAISRNQAVAAVVKSLQKCRAFLQRLLLGNSAAILIRASSSLPPVRRMWSISS